MFVHKPRPLAVVAIYAGGLVALACFLFPILWMALTSFKHRPQAFTETPLWFFHPTLDNYRAVLVDRGFLDYVRNSLIVGVLATVLTLILAVTIAYPIARYRIRGGKQITMWILSLRMLPPIVALVPLYLVFSTLRLVDRYPSLIIMYMFMNLPLAVWLMVGFFADVPRELEEAALVDGASPAGSFFRIALPLVVPGLISTGMLAFIFCWNEFLFANVLTSARTRTAPIGLTEYATPVNILWTEIMAAGTIVVLPVLLMGIFIQRYLVRGLTMGALKG